MYIYYFHKVQSINACPYAHFMATEEPDPHSGTCICVYIHIFYYVDVSYNMCMI